MVVLLDVFLAKHSFFTRLPQKTLPIVQTALKLLLLFIVGL